MSEINQIPGEGERCFTDGGLDCPFLDDINYELPHCNGYKEYVRDYLRLPQCLSDRPQIVRTAQKGKE